LAEEIGADGRDLLDKVYTSTTHSWLQEIPAIDILRSIWIQQYHGSSQGTPWRADQELPPSAQLIQSPYDIEARYSKKKQTGWVGYQVHFTEGCDADQPHCILEVTTTPATIPDGEIMEDLHERLAENQLLPSQHLVDKGYVDAELIAASVNTSTILISLDLFSPILHGQQKTRDALITATFSLIGKQKVCFVQQDSTVEIGVISQIGMESRVCVCGFLLLSVERVHFIRNAPKPRRKYLFCAQMNKAIPHSSKRVNVRKLLSSVPCMQHERGLKEPLLKVYERVRYEDLAMLGSRS
jgi:hypothetical protein